MIDSMVRRRAGSACQAQTQANRIWRSLALLLTSTLVALLLIACGSAEQPVVSIATTISATATPTPPHSQRATPPAATPVPLQPGLGPVQWTTGEDAATGAPIDTIDRFYADSPLLIASVKADLLSVGTTVEAAWFYNQTSLDAFTTTLTIAQAAPERWLSFRLERSTETLWPAGEYEIRLKLNGVDVEQATILVEERS